MSRMQGKALYLSFLASVGLLMLTATSSLAGELKGDWKIEGQLPSLSATVNGSIVHPGESSMLIPGLELGLSCEGVQVHEGTILPLSGGRSIGHGKVTLEGCFAFEHATLEALPFCQIYEREEGVDEGEITAAALFHVVRTGANGTAYVLVEPTGPGSLHQRVFADIYFGELCPIEGLVVVIGSLVVQLTSLEAEVQKAAGVSHEVRLLFGDSLKFGVHEAFVDGEVQIFLTGDHSGESWGIEAGA